jgi:hypothetical protein
VLRSQWTNRNTLLIDHWFHHGAGSAELRPDEDQDWLFEIDDFFVEIGGRDCVHLDGEGYM